MNMLNFSNPNSLFGLSVIVHEDKPKMVLGPPNPGHDDFVTPEFRREIDAWMLDFFGTWNMMKDGEVWYSLDSMFVNPRTFEQIKKASKELL